MEVLKAKVFDLDDRTTINVRAEENKQNKMCCLDVSLIKDEKENVLIAVDYQRGTGKMVVSIYDTGRDKPIFTKEAYINGRA